MTALVTLEAEDQGDVDADAGADDLGDGLEALDRRRDLDHRVRAVDLGPELLGLFDGPRGVVGEAGLDLDRDAAVDAVRGVVDGAEDVGGAGHVIRRDLEDGVVDDAAARRRARRPARRRRAPLARAPAKIVGFVVTPTTFFSAMSFCRPPDVMRSRERSSSQMLTPAAESSARGVVPVMCSDLLHAAHHADASDSLAAATTASVVMPNSRNSVL